MKEMDDSILAAENSPFFDNRVAKLLSFLQVQIASLMKWISTSVTAVT